eukprot:CAMPEP_0170480142 /NCGR_PEP_ID=MMETSP0208-20121228/1096_2 /TAXON_ID=197538 /ORGANISM="Strombidium inclinatum, Strain S3" /LENGTH=73 /DNA_ID=CAMNT_0010752633 /DNA_START=210 /DNA_END=431 /DNA_ORIENTATION=-
MNEAEEGHQLRKAEEGELGQEIPNESSLPEHEGAGAQHLEEHRADNVCSEEDDTLCLYKLAVPLTLQFNPTSS